jgi:tetratricopeptide (TPR) repeat protein
MRVQRKFIVFLLLVIFKTSFSQPGVIIDSLKRELAKVTTAGDKVYLLDILARALMNVKPDSAEKVGREIIEVAEQSRDRKLMVKAYMSNAMRYGYLAENTSSLNKSIEYYNTALQIAKENKLDEEVGAIFLQLGYTQLYIPDYDKALNYINRAQSVLSTLSNDSLKIETNYKFGDVYLSRNEKILSLRNYLTGLRESEALKAKDTREARRKNMLIRLGCINLAGFYSTIGDYDRAIDNYTRAMEQLNKIGDKNIMNYRVRDMNSIGSLYAQKKNYDLAITYFERALAKADSLKSNSLKSLVYLSLLNQYLLMENPKKALTFFNSESGAALKDFLTNFGFAGIIDDAYAVIYTEMQHFDSAIYYFNRAAPYYEKGVSDFSKIGFYSQRGRLEWKMSNYTAAIEYFQKVKEMGEKMNQLESVRFAAQMLDSIYTKTADFKLASEYNALHYKVKDSIDKLNREKELIQVEAASEQLKTQREEKEREEAKRKRYVIQYFGITIAIAVLIIALVMLGMFKVSKRTIELLGFFTFLMLFEFLFLIFKKNVISLTQGEPWKDLAAMILLAAILLPLHHWLEHKVIHHLTSHNRLTAAGKELKTRLFHRKKIGHDS